MPYKITSKVTGKTRIVTDAELEELQEKQMHTHFKYEKIEAEKQADKQPKGQKKENVLTPELTPELPDAQAPEQQGE